jgi:hypothetical protein
LTFINVVTAMATTFLARGRAIKMASTSSLDRVMKWPVSRTRGVEEKENRECP